MNIQMNRWQAGVSYQHLLQFGNYFEQIGMVRSEVSNRRLGGTFTDIETESEMIRSAKMMVESALAAQASIKNFMSDFGDASFR